MQWVKSCGTTTSRKGWLLSKMRAVTTVGRIPVLHAPRCSRPQFLGQRVHGDIVRPPGTAAPQVRLNQITPGRKAPAITVLPPEFPSQKKIAIPGQLNTGFSKTKKNENLTAREKLRLSGKISYSNHARFPCTRSESQVTFSRKLWQEVKIAL